MCEMATISDQGDQCIENIQYIFKQIILIHLENIRRIL